MLSDSPPERDVIWTEDGVRGAARFTQRLWRLIGEAAPHLPPPGTSFDSPDPAAVKTLRMQTHQTLAAVSEEIERLKFNTAVAKIYAFVNTLDAVIDEAGERFASDQGYAAAAREAFDILVQIVAPMMPHLAEECWKVLGHEGLVAQESWPRVDPALLVEDTVTLPVQINGRKRAEVTVRRDATVPEIEQAELQLDAVRQALGGKPPKKVIVVPQRIVNVVA